MQYLTTKTTFCIFFLVIPHVQSPNTIKNTHSDDSKSLTFKTILIIWSQVKHIYRLFIQNHKQKTTNSLIKQFVHWEEFMNLLGFLFIGFLQLVLAMCELWEKSLWTISENVYLSNSVSSNKFLKLPMQWSVHKFL